MTWLETLVKEHSELESPLSFWYWSGLAAISAVVKDNIWLSRADVYNLYPNIYVMLHAESGLKKGPPVAVAKRLVTAVNSTRIISGRSSIQGILKELGTAQTQPGGKVLAKSVAFICSSELSSSIVEDKVATTILTDLYDRQYNVGEWRSLLKMETFNLKDPTITMLTATNEAHSSDFFTRKDVSGGYFARTFIVYETKRNKTNSLIAPLRYPPNYPALSEYLKILSKLQGPFEPLAKEEKDERYAYPKFLEGREVFFTDAGMFYENWYERFQNEADAQEFKDETGTLNRFGDSVLKVAMLISLSKHVELYIDIESMQEAIIQCEKMVGNIRKTTLGKSNIESLDSVRRTIFLRELLTRDNHSITRAMLNKKFWMHGSSQEWDEAALSAEVAGFITLRSIGGQIVYEMVPSAAKDMIRFLEGKNK